MPHWNGYVDAGTPPHLVDIFKQSPSDVEASIREKADSYGDDTTVLAVSWELGKWNRRAHVIVAGTHAPEVLEYFAAKNIRKLKTSEEKDQELESNDTSGSGY
jgi:hypothetical protein